MNINTNIQKYIGFGVLALVIIAGFFLIKYNKVSAPVDTVDTTVVEIPDKAVVPTPDVSAPTKTEGQTNGTEIKPIINTVVLTQEQKDLLAVLKKNVDAKDFSSFADTLLEVYKNKWGEVEDFKKVESSLYVYAYDNYFAKGNLAKSLEVSTIVYGKVPEAWRFRYLRILTLEKYGRDALNAGDLKTAEGYANTILQMMFRTEGTNLLADVYIAKINTNIKAGDTASAKNNLGFIWDYEVSADRRATLQSLKSSLGL